MEVMWKCAENMGNKYKNVGQIDWNAQSMTKNAIFKKKLHLEGKQILKKLKSYEGKKIKDKTLNSGKYPR